jgi:hypothetical protein
VVKIAERQPSLLLSEDVDWGSTESLAQRLTAWEFGLVSDSDPEWRKRCARRRGGPSGSLAGCTLAHLCTGTACRRQGPGSRVPEALPPWGKPLAFS